MAPEGTSPQRRRWPIYAGGAIAVVAVAVVGIRALVLRDTTRAITVDAAIERYHASTTVSTSTPPSTAASATTATAASTTAPPPVLPALPAPGVYRYRTSGSESIDALDGASHDYPSETTITVTGAGCGVHLRWDALVERRDEWDLCATPGGVAWQTEALQYHEFFGQPDAEQLSCDVPVVVVPAPDATTPRPPVQQTCTLADDPWLPVWQVLGSESRTIDGQAVLVTRVTMTVTDDDEYWEHTTLDWYLAPSGLPVELTVTKESRTPSPVGGVIYREHAHLELITLVPAG